MYMGEPLFGSPPQLWPAVAAPAFGYPQALMPAGNRPISAVSPGLISSQTGPFASGVATSMPTPSLPPAFGVGVVPTPGPPGWGMMSSPMTGGMPPFLGQDIAVGVTAQGLLAAVAMRRGQPLGPASDQEIEDFIYDALDLVPGANDVEVRCESGRCTMTGSVPHKRLKRDVGEIAWVIPNVNDVQNNVTIATRRRARPSSRETESSQAAAGRKQA